MYVYHDNLLLMSIFTLLGMKNEVLVAGCMI